MIACAKLRPFERFTVAEWSTWLGCGVAVLGVLAALVIPAGANNRVQGVAVAFGVAALALLANAFTWRMSTWGGVALFVLASLGLAYGIILALSIPLRLAVEGTCPAGTQNCPVGFEHPLTSAENFAVYACTVLGAIGLALVFIAVEMRHVRRPRLPGDQGAPPAR